MPRGNEKDKLLLFLGDNWLRIVGLDWNGFYPIAIKRGITDKNKFPTIINNLQQAKDLVCTSNDAIPPKFELSKLFAWEIKDGDIYNVSENARKIIISEKGCNFQR